MSRCQEYSEDLTAWVDGELPTRETQRISDHIAQCERCAAEISSLRAVIAWQERALCTVAAPQRMDAAALTARLRRSLAAEAEDVRPRWSLRDIWASPWGRVAFAGGGLSVALVIFLLAVGPQNILMPLGLESPPPAVVQHTELFKDYPLIERLDVLEHFDTVDSVPLDDEGASQHG